MDAAGSTATPFVARVAQLLRRVEYRQARTAEERDRLFSLRYAAYLREGAICEREDRRFRDDFDDLANVWIFGVHIDGELVASIRLHVTLPGSGDLPALHVFADIVAPLIAEGAVIVDPTRFVTDHDASRKFPELPYLVLRLPWMALEHFQADVMLATVRAEHQAFYRRLWGHRAACPPRPYPTLTKPIACMILEYAEARDRVHLRYPFFRSTATERRAVFAAPQAPSVHVPALKAETAAMSGRGVTAPT